jgi:hypothetical protein
VWPRYSQTLALESGGHAVLTPESERGFEFTKSSDHQALWQGLLGRPAAESGTLCHGDGPRNGATAAGGG